MADPWLAYGFPSLVGAQPWTSRTASPTKIAPPTSRATSPTSKAISTSPGRWALPVPHSKTAILTPRKKKVSRQLARELSGLIRTIERAANRATQAENAVAALAEVVKATIVQAQRHLDNNSGSLRRVEYTQVASSLADVIKRCVLDAHVLSTTLASVRAHHAGLVASAAEMASHLEVYLEALSPAPLSPPGSNAVSPAKRLASPAGEPATQLEPMHAA